MNICVGEKDKRLRQDKVYRALIYNIIKGWADPKTFKLSMERYWPLECDRKIDIIMPTNDEIRMYDQRFRSIGKKNG